MFISFFARPIRCELPSEHVDVHGYEGRRRLLEAEARTLAECDSAVVRPGKVETAAERRRRVLRVVS